MLLAGLFSSQRWKLVQIIMRMRLYKVFYPFVYEIRFFLLSNLIRHGLQKFLTGLQFISLAAIDKVCQKNSNTKSVKVTNQEKFGFNRYTFGLDYDLKCKWTWQAYRESETPTDCYLKCIEFLMRYIREWVKYYLFMRFPFLLLSCS